MFTFHFWLISSVQMIVVFIAAIALVYITKLIDLWLDEREKEHFVIRFINLAICDIASDIAIAMPFVIFFYMLIMGIIVILV